MMASYSWPLIRPKSWSLSTARTAASACFSVSFLFIIPPFVLGLASVQRLRVEYHNADASEPCGVSPSERHTIRKVAGEIADALKRDNARFSRMHFLAVVRGEKDLNSRPARS